MDFFDMFSENLVTVVENFWKQSGVFYVRIMRLWITDFWQAVKQHMVESDVAEESQRWEKICSRTSKQNPASTLNPTCDFTHSVEKQ